MSSVLIRSKQVLVGCGRVPDHPLLDLSDDAFEVLACMLLCDVIGTTNHGCYTRLWPVS